MSTRLTAEPTQFTQRESQTAQGGGPYEDSSRTLRGIAASLWKRPVLVWLCAATIPGLILGMAAFFAAVGPLEQRLLELEAHGLARDIDSIIEVRSSAVKIAARGIDIDEISEAGALDNLLTSFRQAFSDFLSLEVLDEDGQVVAMVGELPLSQARRFSGRSIKSKQRADALSTDDRFIDDPKAGCFFVTARHKGADGTPWYSRTRFSRDPIQALLNSEGNGWSASLRKIPPAGAKGDTGSPALFDTLGRWWGSLDTADASLTASGWGVELHKPSKWTMLSRLPVIVVALILLGSIIACICRKYTSRRVKGKALSMTTRSSQQRSPDAVIASANMRVVPRCNVRPGETDPCETVVDREAEYDTWTPRNIPIGLQPAVDSIESEPCETAYQSSGSSHPEGTDEFATRRTVGGDVHGERPPKAVEESFEAAPPERHTAEFPDMLDVDWFEPEAPLTARRLFPRDCCSRGPSRSGDTYAPATSSRQPGRCLDGA